MHIQNELLRVMFTNVQGKGLEAEGVEGHVEEVGVLRRLGATAAPQQPAMEQRLGALHARSAGQQRARVLRLRLIHEEPRMAYQRAAKQAKQAPAKQAKQAPAKQAQKLVTH